MIIPEHELNSSNEKVVLKLTEQRFPEYIIKKLGCAKK